MAKVLKARIIKIGNSQGIRIPSLFLEQLGLTGEVELVVQDDQLVVRSARSGRQGWEEQFKRLAGSGEDSPLDETANRLTEWEEDEWEW